MNLEDKYEAASIRARDAELHLSIARAQIDALIDMTGDMQQKINDLEANLAVWRGEE